MATWPGVARVSMTRARLPLLLVAVVAAACGMGEESVVGPAAPTAASAPSVLGTLQPGQPLPGMELARLDGGGTVDTGELRGPAVINFWATWCAFCVEEMPALERVHQQVGERVRFLGVDREDDPVRALTLAERTGVTYELVTDPDGSFFRAVQARGMPTTVLVDASGTIAHRHAGPLEAAELLDLIERHLDVDISSLE